MTTSAKRGKTPPTDTLTPGERIIFRPGYEGRKPWRHGEFVKYGSTADSLEVKLDGDPFTVCVNYEQVTRESEETGRKVSNMPATATRPTAKELRRQAKALGIEGWEEMGLADLRTAVEEAEAEESTPRRAKKTTAKATSRRAAVVEEDEDEDTDEDEPEDEEEEDEAPARRSRKSTARPAKKASSSRPAKNAAKKTATKKTTARKAVATEDEFEPAENGNPFRPGTNLFYIAEEVIKGGKRSSMVKRLKKKIDLKPRQRAGSDFDEDAELDRRVLIVGQILRKEHGFNVVRDGRGVDATIIAEAP